MTRTEAQHESESTMKRITSSAPRPAQPRLKDSWHPRDFVSYQHQFNGTYNILLDRSLDDIFSLLKPGVHYTNIPWGLVSLNIEYDNDGYEIIVRSHTEGVDNAIVDTARGKQYGFTTPYDAFTYMCGYIPTKSGKARTLTQDALNDIWEAFRQLIGNADENRGPMTKNYHFYYGDIEFTYTLSSNRKSPQPKLSSWERDLESIRALTKDPYGWGGGIHLTKGLDKENKDRDVRSWVNYLNKEGYDIEPLFSLGLIW